MDFFHLVKYILCIPKIVQIYTEVICMQYVWLGILLLAGIVEAVTAGLVSIWFVPAALVSMILAMCGVPVYLQVTVFFGLSIIFLVLSRTIWKKYISAKPVSKTNADALIGQVGIVTEEIDNIAAFGEVKINGQRWSARSSNGTVIAKDTHVRVLAIEGVKLICETV